MDALPRQDHALGAAGAPRPLLGDIPVIDASAIPTHLALVARRLKVTGIDNSGDTWLMTSYVAESFLKTVACVLVAGIRKSNPSIAYKLEYELVRADGLGSWEKIIGDCTGHALASYLDSDLQPLVAWITKRRTQADDQWARDAATRCADILSLLAMPDADPPSRLSVRHIFGQLVRIRNKTKAHGAAGADFFAKANSLYTDAIALLISHCPFCSWHWFHLSTRPTKHNVRALLLRGLEPTHKSDSDALRLTPALPGLHFQTHDKGHLFHLGSLIRVNNECSEFGLPNGAFSQSGSAEFVDYASGKVEHVSLPQYLQPPAPLPASATEGALALEIFSNVFGNLPPQQTRYVTRPALEAELNIRLRDKNHPIITLHGRGGIGKTSLALHAAHGLAADPQCNFDYILWISARDLELKPSGASEVRRAVADLSTVCRLLGAILGIDASAESLALLLQDPSVIGSTGILFIFDNFETVDDPRELHKFLDTHTHLPNKILITSRERAFKADYTIEVEGMEYDEARTLLRRESSELGIEGILDEGFITEIHEYTDGHPYVMRVLLGEIAKDKRRIPLKSLVPRRSDLLDVVFERSFNKLSEDARWVFLCVSNWRSAIPELALIVTLGLRSLDAERGIDECLRLSLLSRHDLADDRMSLSAPELARHFGRKKLEGDPDRLLIKEDLELIQAFGAVQIGQAARLTVDTSIDKLYAKAIEAAERADRSTVARFDSILTHTAELHPAAWLRVAEFRQKLNKTYEQIDEALRRAVEEMPYSRDAWLARARHAQRNGADTTRIAALVSAVDADPSDVELIREVAFELCRYIGVHKSEIPVARRGVYVASVRSHMEALTKDLDATGLSRLAWLFLLEDDKDGAWKYANMGLAKESTNSHCVDIVERLSQQGYTPPAVSSCDGARCVNSE